MHKDVDRIMLSEKEIKEKVQEMGTFLDKVYEGKEPVVVCILKGSIVFFSDLIRNMKTTMTLDFLCVSSYGNGSKSSGELVIKKDLSVDITGKDVLLVEDIIDSGNTLYKLKKLLQERNPASLHIVTLLDKPVRREAPMQAEYTCFTVEDEFVVGYGLDYAERYRNLPYVGVLKRSLYEK